MLFLTETIEGRVREGTIDRVTVQSVYNYLSTEGFDEGLLYIKKVLENKTFPKRSQNSQPESPVDLFLFGNMLYSEEDFLLFEECGANIKAESLCTGSRLFDPVRLVANEPVIKSYARSLLNRPACARTLCLDNPEAIVDDILVQAEQIGAEGVLSHVMKFCDPYLARLPVIREKLKNRGLPMLMLEGDCTRRSIEQHRTRIEAFVEMLK